jgi:hypothetical protein
MGNWERTSPRRPAVDINFCACIVLLPMCLKSVSLAFWYTTGLVWV